MGYARAFLVLVVGAFGLAAYFGAVAPALEGLLSAVSGNQAVQSSGSPVSVGIISDIQFIVFILGPMIFLLATVLLPLVFAVRREVFAGRRGR
jgi:uncharacterized protein involved in cysteine biosynthesis